MDSLEKHTLREITAEEKISVACFYDFIACYFNKKCLFGNKMFKKILSMPLASCDILHKNHIVYIGVCVILLSLVIRKNEMKLDRWIYCYILVSFGCLLFGLIYERFSQELYSYYMIYIFIVPLVGGAFVSFLLQKFSKKYMPGRIPFFIISACRC